MASSRYVALGLAWVALAAGCGEAQRAASGASKLTRAETSLQAELEAVVDHLGMPAEPGERVPPVRCDDGARHDVTSGYRIHLKLHGDGEKYLDQAEGVLAPARPPRPRDEPRRRLPGGVRDRRSRLDVRAPAVPRARRGGRLRRDALPARSGSLTGAADTLGRVDERALAERLITYDTSSIDGLRAAAGFVKGWLEAREIDVEDHDFNGLPVLTAAHRAARRADRRPPRPRRRRALAGRSSSARAWRAIA